MTWKDKLELGLKEDAPFRKDNLPENEVRGPEDPRDRDDRPWCVRRRKKTRPQGSSQRRRRPPKNSAWIF